MSPEQSNIVKPTVLVTIIWKDQGCLVTSDKKHFKSVNSRKNAALNSILAHPLEHERSLFVQDPVEGTTLDPVLALCSRVLLLQGDQRHQLCDVFGKHFVYLKCFKRLEPFQNMVNTWIKKTTFIRVQSKVQAPYQGEDIFLG